MSNPFKVGDKVMRRKEWCTSALAGHEHTVFTVVRVGLVFGRPGVWLDNEPSPLYNGGWQSDRMRAAIAGEDYALPHAFAVGDKVECVDGWAPNNSPMTVTKVEGSRVWTDNCHMPGSPWLAGRLRHAETPQPAANTGDLPDGSSVQKHSAGPIYPCVITLRDKRLKGTGLFDYGITSPRNPEPVWLSTLEAAHAVADIINKDSAQ